MHAQPHGSAAPPHLSRCWNSNLLLTAVVSLQTSLGGLRQEVDAVKQLGNSRSNSSPQQQLSYPGQQQLNFQGELLDPLHGFSARLSTSVRRSALAASEASGTASAVCGPQAACRHAGHTVQGTYTSGQHGHHPARLSRRTTQLC